MPVTCPPIRHCTVMTADLRLGLVCDTFSFEWFPPEQRSPAAQESYARLEADIRERGVLRPIIVWRHPDTDALHVLVGMRRVEIARRIGIGTLEAIEVLDDVREWWTEETGERVRSLKAAAGEVGY